MGVEGIGGKSHMSLLVRQRIIGRKLTRLLFCFGWLFFALTPGLSENVTFETYPKNAKINVGPVTDFTPIGTAGQAIELSGHYEQSVLKLVISAEGRKPWSRTFTSGELPSGTFSERVYLHPTNPLMYLVDFPLAFPVSFAIVMLVLFAGGTYYYRQESGKKRRLAREESLLALGKEYEKEHGDYILIKDLGKGAYGLVRLAVKKDRIGPEGLVAIKTMFLERSSGPSGNAAEMSSVEEDEISRFRREAKILQKADHPNILDVHEWGELNSEHYIVMELLEGTDLKKYLSGKPPLSLDEVREIFSQLASALDYLHERKVFHRDLKPANIQRTLTGHIKLIDFGLATSSEQTSELTQEGAIMGTFDYMAPEHFQGRKQDALYDQFAVGAIIFELLTGRLPHDEPPAGADLGTLLRLYISPRRPLSEFRPDLSLEITAVVDKMVNLNPEDRFESVMAAFKAFDQACSPLAKSGSPDHV